MRSRLACLYSHGATGSLSSHNPYLSRLAPSSASEYFTLSAGVCSLRNLNDLL
jgi:hypothetical protein